MNLIEFAMKFGKKLSGSHLQKLGNSSFVNKNIQSIRKNSPAERAGLLKEDKILILNGHLSTALTLNDINSSFRSKEGRKIKIIIMRNGIKVKKQFRLEKVL